MALDGVRRLAHNRCVEPTHQRSLTNGRCLDCACKLQAQSRKKRRIVLGAPRRAEVFEGKPCRICAGTERYVHGRTCVRCTRGHGRKRAAASILGSYHIPAEFHQWITAPLLELTSV